MSENSKIMRRNREIAIQTALCRMTEERDALKAELAEMTRSRDSWQKAQQEFFAAAAANADTCARLQEQVRVLSAPLSAEERLAAAFRFGGGSIVNEFDRIVAARTVRAQQKDSKAPSRVE